MSEPPPEPPSPHREDQRGRLAALREGRGGAFDAAYRSLRAELERYARALAGARAGQADFEPESIVAGALAKGMGAAVQICKDDGHLAGRLKQAVKHELFDRADRLRPQQMPEDRPFEPRDEHAGPATEFAHAQARSGDREALERLFRQLDEVALGENDRALIEHYVIERLDWASIAERLKTTEGAARVAMKRLRDRLLPKIFAPIRARVSDDDWRIAEAMFVRRKTIAEFVKEAASLGVRLDERQTRAAAVERVIPAVIAEWGGQSTELVLRLTGHRR